VRIPSRIGLSAANGQTAQKLDGYKIQYGKCSKIVGTRTRDFDGKFVVCATGFLTRLPHESRASRASEEARGVSDTLSLADKLMILSQLFSHLGSSLIN